MGEWALEHWLELLNAVGVVGSLLFTAFALREETKTRRVTNLLTLTQNHREVWSILHRNPALARVLDSRVDLLKQPATREEEFLVNFLIQHLNVAYHAMRDRLYVRPEGMDRDVAEFFSLPIPRAVWKKLKPLQDEDFVRFVEAAQLEACGKE